MKNAKINALNTLCENRLFPLLFIPLAAIFLLFYSISTSPFFAFEGGDSAIFQEIGLAITHGKVLYHDIFDNKGPLLYWINALGMAWGGTIGILMLQVLFQALSLYFLFLISRLFTNGLHSFLVLLITIVIYSVFLLEGNQCEEWMLPFISASFYSAIKTLQEEKTPFPSKRAFVLGICFGLTFFIRPNDAVGIIGGLTTGLFLYLIWHHRKRDAVRFVSIFFAGLSLISIPILIYFAVNHAINDLYLGLIGINIGYTSGLEGMIRSFLSDSGSWLLLPILGTACIMLLNTPLRKAIWALVPCCLFELILFGKSFYFHYYISILPIYTLILATFSSIHKRSLVAIATLVITFTPVGYSYRIVPKKAISLAYHQLQAVGENYHYAYGDFLDCDEKEMQKHMTAIEQLGSHIPSTELDSVWNYNIIEHISCRNYFNYIFFAHNKIVQMNRMTFPLLENMDPNPVALNSPPLWIVTNGNSTIQQDSAFTSQYSLIQSYCSWNGEIQLYKKRE